MQSDDADLADFIRRQRLAGLPDAATAARFKCSASTLRSKIKRLEAQGFDCGQSRFAGKNKAHVWIVPDTEPAGEQK